MARAPEVSFLCTQVTLQSHVFLSCKSTESGGLQLFHLAAASSSPFFDWLLSKESSFGFAVSTDPAAGVTQFKFQGSLTWVTSSESCPSSWNKSLLKEVTESRMWFYLSVYSSWCKWICPLETLQLATLSLLTLLDVAVQSSLSFSNSLLEQFVFQTVNLTSYFFPATTWKISKKAFCTQSILMKRVHKKDDFLQAYTAYILQVLTTGPTYVKNNIKIFGSKLICF